MSLPPSTPPLPDALTLLLSELHESGGSLSLTPNGLMLKPPKKSPASDLVVGQLKARRAELLARLWSEVVPSKCGACRATVFLPDPGSAGFCERTDCPYRRTR